MYIISLLHSLLYFTLTMLIIQIFNAYVINGLKQSIIPIKDKQYVSILVPARNEENNIARCVLSLLGQSYDSFEVIVLNDQSEDNTAAILTDIVKQYPHLKVIEGKDLPRGWLGKPWACHQLAASATGDWLLFTDADTIHKPDMLKSVMGHALKDKPGLVTAFTKQEMHTLGEKLIVSYPFWSIFSLFPMILAIRFGLSIFCAANGQFMLFSKTSYHEIGGHESVKNQIADDFSLAKLILKKHKKLQIYNMVDFVSCRMYRSFSEALQGFAKNYFAIFDYRIIQSLFVWVWMFILCWLPLFIVIVGSLYSFVPFSMMIICTATILLQTLLWVNASVQFRMPAIVLVLYPAIIAISSFIGIYSIFQSLRQKTTWKGRSIPKINIRWF